MASSTCASDPRLTLPLAAGDAVELFEGPSSKKATVTVATKMARRIFFRVSLPGFTEEEALRVLQKGTGLEGEVLRPPMHIYHMNQEDAKAIVAYLKSLQPPVH
jgi:hypothetical protein